MIITLPVLTFLSFGSGSPAQQRHVNPLSGPSVDEKRHALTKLISSAARYFASNRSESERRQQYKSSHRATCYPVAVGCGRPMHRLSNISAVT